MIDVLGTMYEIICCDSCLMEDDNIGECDRYNKIIRINQEYFSQKNVNINAKFKTMRHEIIHAFLHEAGLDCYSEDEILVDALAVLIPKIMLCCKLAEDEVSFHRGTNDMPAEVIEEIDKVFADDKREVKTDE